MERLRPRGLPPSPWIYYVSRSTSDIVIAQFQSGCQHLFCKNIYLRERKRPVKFDSEILVHQPVTVIFDYSIVTNSPHCEGYLDR